MFDDNQIRKNSAIISENLYQLSFISLLIFFISFFMFILSIVHDFHDINFNSQILILSIITIFQAYKSVKPLLLIDRSNRTEKIIDDIFQAQLLLILILSISQISSVYLIIQQYDVTTLEFVIILVMGSNTLINTIISNYVKLYLYFLIQLYISIQTYLKWNLLDSQGDNGRMQVISLHFQILMQSYFVAVKQLILVKSWKEFSERVELSFHTMHDLRNQLQSFIELANTILSNKYQVDPIHHYVNNKKSYDANINIDNSMVNITDRSSDNDHINITKKTTYEKSNNNKSEDDEIREEFNLQQRFILFKVCFLYHMELIFEKAQNLNPEKKDIRQIIQSSSETIKVLFMNKSSNIQIDFKSYVKEVEIDAVVLEQLLVHMAKFFHDLKYNNIVFQIMVISNEEVIELMIWVVVDDLNPQTIHEVKNKHIFSRLIESLHQGIEFNIIEIENKIKFTIRIPDQDQQVFNNPDTKNLLISKINNSNRSLLSESIKSQNSKVEFKPINSEGSDYLSKKINQSKIKNTKLQKNSVNLKNNQNLNKTSINSQHSHTNKTGKSKSTNKTNELHQTYIQKFHKPKLIQSETIYVKLIEDKKLLSSHSVQQQEPIIIETNDHKSNDQCEFEDDYNQKQKEQLSHNNSPQKPRKLSKIDEIIENESTKIEKLDKVSSKRKSLKQKSEKLTDYFVNHREVEQVEKDGIVFINVDDEDNILKMNKRVFSKENVTLNGVKTIDEFLNLLKQIYLNGYDRDFYPSCLCVMDHMLDREQGYEAVSQAKQMNKILSLDLTFILLSSTEDKETLDKYSAVGVDIKVTKPLNKSKLKPILENQNFMKHIDQ